MKIEDVENMIRQAHLPEKTVDLCLRGDLVAEWEDLERQLSQVKASTTVKLAGGSGMTQIAEQMASLQEQMAEFTIVVRMRALSRPKWMRLCNEHQPRKDDPADRSVGINRATFYPALIRACWIAPEISAKGMRKLIGGPPAADESAESADAEDNEGVLTSAQFDSLFDAAWGLNRHDVSVPFSRTASLITASSGETSKQPSDSASATSGSAAGSRKRSPSTRTTKKAS